MQLSYSVDTQVLIIGSGNAGIKAALQARKQGSEVLLVSEKKFGHTGSTFYPGTPGWGCLTVNFEGDSKQHFLDEIIEAGQGTAEPKLSKILVEDSLVCFDELEELGLKHEKNEKGEHIAVVPCFGKRKRGGAIMNMDKIRKVLWKNLMKNGIRVRSGVTVLNLVIKDGVCVGAVGIDEADNFFFIRAKATVLATGGACNLYKHSLATSEQTGDGYLLGLESGAKLVNLEFIQFIPGSTAPLKKMLFHEKILDHFPKITNVQGKEFIYDYLPDEVSYEHCLIERAKHGPFTNIDESRYFDIAMYEEERAKRACSSGGLHMLYPEKAKQDERNTSKKWLKWMADKGMDIAGEGIDMIPHAQGFNGGIYIDENASAGVPGLFAAGETAGGPHGADRMGGAAITATQVFGRRAGNSAAKYAKEKDFADVSSDYAEEYTIKFLDSGTGGVVDIEETMQKVQNIMWNCGAIVRSHERCIQGLKELDKISSKFNPIAHLDAGVDIKQVTKLRSYIEVSKLLLKIMDYRKESRGPHYRVDYPKPSKAFEGAVTVSMKNGETNLELVKYQ